jgi:hypothetical protein
MWVHSPGSQATAAKRNRDASGDVYEAEMARSASAFLAAAAFALALPALGEAACPRLIMVSGESLPARILIHEWDEACKLYAAFFASPAADATTRIATRPSLRLGLFWNALLWEPYVRQHRLAELRPDDANQFGRFYPGSRRGASPCRRSGLRAVAEGRKRDGPPHPCSTQNHHSRRRDGRKRSAMARGRSDRSGTTRHASPAARSVAALPQISPVRTR